MSPQASAVTSWYTLMCAGTILNAKIVVTSGQCVYNVAFPRELYVFTQHFKQGFILLWF